MNMTTKTRDEWLLEWEARHLQEQKEKKLTRAERAIKALREPDYTLARVPNTIRQSIAEVIEDQTTALERAYGVLWRMPDAATGHARKLLLEAIDKEGQRRGIEYAIKMFGPATESELLANSP